jgi:hypothetical protein
LDKYKPPIAGASVADNCATHTVAPNALAIFDVADAHSFGSKYKASDCYARIQVSITDASANERRCGGLSPNNLMRSFAIHDLSSSRDGASLELTRAKEPNGVSVAKLSSI